MAVRAPKSKAKIPLTPAEKRARKRVYSIVTSVVFLVIIAVGLGVTAKILLTEEEVERSLTMPDGTTVALTGTQNDVAAEALQNAESARGVLTDAIDRRDAAGAKEALVLGQAWLQ